MVGHHSNLEKVKNYQPWTCQIKFQSQRIKWKLMLQAPPAANMTKTLAPLPLCGTSPNQCQPTRAANSMSNLNMPTRLRELSAPNPVSTLQVAHWGQTATAVQWPGARVTPRNVGSRKANWVRLTWHPIASRWLLYLSESNSRPSTQVNGGRDDERNTTLFSTLLTIQSLTG